MYTFNEPVENKRDSELAFRYFYFIHPHHLYSVPPFLTLSRVRGSRLADCFTVTLKRGRRVYFNFNTSTNKGEQQPKSILTLFLNAKSYQ